jgi:pimeloyl-ACP methyl ester carboxylesterase/predicted glycosyltransferase
VRACEPERTGHVERSGVRLYWEEFGSGADVILFMPTWSIIHSRHWKSQVPYFARHYRVITFDGRGSGGSDRPSDPRCYGEDDFAADAMAVLDATETHSAIVVSLSMGAIRSLILAAHHPERVRGLAFLNPSLRLAPLPPERDRSFIDPLDTEEGWAKFNQHYWRRNYHGFLEFFFSQMFTEPHSTKQIEDCVGWGLETTPEVLIASVLAPKPDRAELLELCAQVRCPALVVHGTEDAISPPARAEALAAATNATLVLLGGAGHGPHARDPVQVNLLLRDFADRLRGGVATPAPAPAGPATPVAAASVAGPTQAAAPESAAADEGMRVLHRPRAMRRPRRALFISSPIGLGHALRDVSIARELRRRVPGLQIDWLAQHPVTRMLEVEGERVHPASAWLASESRHMECESAEHDLHCFQAWRRMDEILVANFMVFHDVIREEQYDLWIGDEAWELDYYLHENPEQKRSPYVWLTDFVGWLPLENGGERERFLTADYNAEMIGHIARYPHVRDRALFVGNPDDIVPERFGPDLPGIREWTEAHYSFPGYISGFDPATLGDREAMRAELGYDADDKVCLVSVGGSGVGAHLLRRVIAAFPEAKRRVPGLRMIVVAGPRIDPASLPQAPGLEVRSYVHNLYRHLFACDLAVVQGGLTTAMELTASRRPFLYFPLRHHFEQNVHVPHRLQRYGAGRRMDYETATPECLADAIAAEIGRPVAYRAVETDGAGRAAELIASLL